MAAAEEALDSIHATSMTWHTLHFLAAAVERSVSAVVDVSIPFLPFLRRDLCVCVCVLQFQPNRLISFGIRRYGKALEPTE